ncbi:MAG: hypothetical protein U0R64_07450 [Candidatus Nanopelagicales bacterium]
MILSVGNTWAKAMSAAVIAIPLALAGCSGEPTPAQMSASASPSATAKVMVVDYGVDEINVAVGQSVDSRAPGEVLWSAASSDESVFQAIQPTDDP